jgi:NAD(P)H-dependent flavin oxidoreductase YrpB (nitropropane dioxygenase family)
MAITTRLTRRLNITHPIISAPMDLASGGELAGAVSASGGLGLIGGGYAESDVWLDEAFQAAGNQRIHHVGVTSEAKPARSRDRAQTGRDIPVLR